MTRTITDWRNGQVIWTGEADTVKGALMAAHASRADLSGADLSWSDLSRADLSWADLSWSNLSGANLSGANLSGANLSGANLSWSNLSGANLSRANLSGANLSGANLSGANLSRADLSWADLSWSNLSRADLSRANLSGANLSGANLSRANLCPVTVLLSSIGQVSDDLCSDLMNYGAANCPNGVELFGVWASGGACPYAMLKVQRVANFTEDRKLWRPDRPLLSAFELMKRVLREKCANSDYHDVKESK